MPPRPKNLYQYFQVVLDGVRSLLKGSPHFNGNLRELQLQWRENLPTRQAKRHRCTFKTNPREYPPRIEIEEAIIWNPEPGILVKRSLFRYEWGYKDGELAQKFPRHAFNSADHNHPQHHYHACGPGRPLCELGIRFPENDLNLLESYLDWLKNHVTP